MIAITGAGGGAGGRVAARRRLGGCRSACSSATPCARPRSASNPSTWPVRAGERIGATNDAGYPAPIGLPPTPSCSRSSTAGCPCCWRAGSRSRSAGCSRCRAASSAREESPEQTAERKLREKTGVGSVHLEQLRTYAEPERDPRGWLPSIAYLALVAPEALPERRPADRDASWHPIDALPELALDHARIVDDGLWRLRARVADKAWFMRVGGGLLPEEFTLAQAQRLYEAIARRAGRPGELPPRREGHRPARRHGPPPLRGPGPSGHAVPAELLKDVFRTLPRASLGQSPVHRGVSQRSANRCDRSWSADRNVRPMTQKPGP